MRRCVGANHNKHWYKDYWVERSKVWASLGRVLVQPPPSPTFWSGLYPITSTSNTEPLYGVPRLMIGLGKCQTLHTNLTQVPEATQNANFALPRCPVLLRHSQQIHTVSQFHNRVVLNICQYIHTSRTKHPHWVAEICWSYRGPEEGGKSRHIDALAW